MEGCIRFHKPSKRFDGQALKSESPPRSTISFGKNPPAVGEQETIFYATDRNRSGNSEPDALFTNERSSEG